MEKNFDGEVKYTVHGLRMLMTLTSKAIIILYNQSEANIMLSDQSEVSIKLSDSGAYLSDPGQF